MLRGFVCALLVAAVATLRGVASAATGPPEIVWASWQNVSADSTNGTAFVVANGATTTVHADYAQTGSPFCTNMDGTGTGSTATAIQTLDASSPALIVGSRISGLTPGISYCVTAVAVNVNGTTRSEFTTFVAGAPAAETQDVQPTGAETARVSGTANAAGQPNATMHVDYGPASSPWCSGDGATEPAPSHSADQTLGASDAADHDVALDVAGLSPGQDYCAEIVARTAAGISPLGGTVTFTAGAPSADTATVTVTGSTTVSVAGSVNGAGQQTTYKAEYDTDESPFCQDPDTYTAAHATTPAVLQFADAEDHAVAVDIGGLTAAADYCVRITAQNPSATATSTPLDLQAGAATATADSVTVTAAATADVGATINPGGSSTSYVAEFDTADSGWCQGTLGATPSHTTGSHALGPHDTSDHPVTAGLTGLTPGTTYCVDIRASNAGGAVTTDQLTFEAGAAIPTTANAFSTGPATAEVDGTVNPSGQQTTVAVGYDLANSTWCVSATGNPAFKTTPVTLPQADTTPHDVSLNLSGLTPATRYCAALLASNAVSAASTPRVFTAGAPVVDGGSATPVGPASESVAGTVGASGQAGTTYQVDYAPADAPFCQSAGVTGSPSSTTAASLGFTDSTPHPVAIDLPGLRPGISYCWRISATNPTATSHTALHLFTVGLPVVTTDPAAEVAVTTATLNARVDGENLPTTYYFDWDLATSAWCASGGTSGEAAQTTTVQPLGVTDPDTHGVKETIAGLAGSTQYCYRAVARNAAAVVSGEIASFTTSSPGAGGGPAPDVATGAATDVTPAGAVLHGTVAPNGSATAYHFDYGSDTTYGKSTPVQNAGAGEAAAPVSATVDGLAPGTEYHYRLVAESAGGRSEGSDMTFTTASPNPGGGGGGGGGGLPGAPGTIFVQTVQVSPGLDVVRGKVVIGEDRTTFRAQLAWSGRLAKVNIVGRVVMRGLHRGVVPFVVRLDRRAKRAFRRKSRLAVTLTTRVTPQSGPAIVKTKRVVMKRGRRGHGAK